jgi:hypothetical protein
MERVAFGPKFEGQAKFAKEIIFLQLLAAGGAGGRSQNLGSKRNCEGSVVSFSI